MTKVQSYEEYQAGKSMLIVDYNSSHYEEWFAESIVDAEKCMKENTSTWINVNCVCDSPIMDETSDYFGLSQLVASNLMKYDSKQQLLIYPEYSYLNLYNLTYNLKEGEIHTDRICAIFGKEILLTFQENSGSLFKPVRERIKHGNGQVRKMGVDYLQYLLLNSIIDHITGEHNKIEMVIKALESGLQNESEDARHKLFGLSHLLISVQKFIEPMVITIAELKRTKPFISQNMAPYFDDLYMTTVELGTIAKAQQSHVHSLLSYYK